MPRTNGVFTLVPSYRATPGQTIRTEQHNPPLEDIEQAMTDSLPRDGSAPMTGNLPMNGRKITGLAAGTDPGDAVRNDQVTPYSAYQAAVSALTFTANKIAYATGAATAAITDLTAFGRSLIGAANAGAARTTLGLGAASLLADSTDVDLSNDPNAVARRGLVDDAISARPSGIPSAVLEERRLSGNAPPAYTANTWNKVELTTEVYDPNGSVSTVSSEFTFTSNGWVRWSSPGRDSFQTRLYNVTDSAVVELGDSVLTAGGSVSHSCGECPVVAGKTYRLEHNSSGTQSGRPAGRGGSEIYSRVTFWGGE